MTILRFLANLPREIAFAFRAAWNEAQCSQRPSWKR
jgi:hypothetical protein